MTTAPSRSDEPAALQALAADVRSATEFAIDDLQVAAVLESVGVTDDLARTTYHSRDVFDLASRIRALTTAQRPVEDTRAQVPFYDDLGASRVLNGLIYLLPAVALPAILMLYGSISGIVAVLTGGGLGWVWCGVMSWLAFARRGQDRPAAAARLMLRLVLVGVTVGAFAGLGVAWITRTGLSVAVLTLGLMVYQLAATQLFFHGRRIWLLAAGAPAALGGILHLATGYTLQLSHFVASAAALGVVVALGLSTWRGRTEAAGRDEGGRAPWDRQGTGTLLAYSTLSAAFLLLPQTLLIWQGFDTGVGLGGLIVAMGVVEWRAVCLDRQARQTLTDRSSIAGFRRELARVCVRNAVLVAAAATLTGGVLGLILFWRDRLSGAGVEVLVTGAVLAAAYTLVFELANLGGYPLLCAILTGLIALDVTLALAGVAASDLLLVASTALFVLVFVAILTRPVAAFR